MSIKKKMKEKDLENVAGGLAGGGGNKRKCPSCDYLEERDKFNPVTKQEGCDAYVTYTCPSCGYSWTVSAN